MQKRLEFLEKEFNNLSSDEINYLRIIMDSLVNKEQLSITEKKLIMKMAIREKCEYYGYPIIDVDFANVNNSEGGHYEQKTNKIILNSNILSNNILENATLYPFFADQTRELDRILLISNHECEHYFQCFDYKKGILSRKSFSWIIFYLINKYTDKNSQGKSEYKVNYNFKEIENYANIQGWYDTGLFLARHKSLNIDQDVLNKLWLQSSARQNISSQKGKDGKKEIIENYNIRELIEIVDKNPSVIDQIPILSNFFYVQRTPIKRGKLKDLTVLLSQYKMIEQQYGNEKSREQVEEEKFVYRQFFYYLIGKDASIVSSKYNDVLYELALYEFISLQGIFDIENKQEDSYERISKIKIDRICNFLNRLEENKADKLCDKLMNIAKETLKVYETSKLMYNDYNASVEKYMRIIREFFSLDNIEYRNPEDRKSAINI